jgi:hypothetical protein
MRVEREGARVRHRSLTVASGQRAEVWLEAGAGRVALHTVRVNGGGAAYWKRCSEAGCFGAAIGSSGGCLAHVGKDERENYFHKVLSESQALTLQGVEVTEQLWDELLRSLSSDGKPRRVKPQINCSGAVFCFKIRLSDWAFDGGLWLTGAVLEDGCEIRQCNFQGLGLSFVDVTDGPAYFPNCTIGRDLWLSYAHCDKQHVAFVDCEVHGDVQGEGFVGDLRLDQCSLQGACHLPKGSFKHLSLAESRVSKELNLAGLEAEFMRAPGLEAMTSSSFGPITVKSYCDISGAQFGARVQLTVSAESLDLRGATFQRGGRLEVQRALVDLERVILGAPLTVVGTSAAVKSIRDADAGSLSFAHIDMSRCLFYGSYGLRNITLEPTVELRSSPKPFRTRRRCIADEFAWRARHSRFRRHDWVIPGTRLTQAGPGEGSEGAVVLPELTAAQVSEVYRSLRKSLESQSNEPGAADFYYGEMEMRRKDRGLSRSERLVILLYWLASGYGLRSLRALACLVSVTLIGALLMLKAGLTGRGHRFADALIAAAQSAMPGVAVSEQLTNWGKAIDLGLTLLGPVFFALAVLALRNRVKR